MTVALFVITVVAWAALEMYFIYTKQPTISERIRTLYGRAPALGMLAGFLVGLLLGHFFWAN